MHFIGYSECDNWERRRPAYLSCNTSQLIKGLFVILIPSSFIGLVLIIVYYIYVNTRAKPNCQRVAKSNTSLLCNSSKLGKEYRSGKSSIQYP